MLTRKSRLLLSLTAAAPMLIAGCTDNTLTNPLDDAAGTYQLTIFANATVPYEFPVSAGEDPELPNGGTILVTDGDLVLTIDGDFVETNNFTKTPPGGQSFASAFVSTGTYTVTGTTLRLAAPQQNGYSSRNLGGTVDLDRVSYVENGFGYEYRR